MFVSIGEEDDIARAYLALRPCVPTSMDKIWAPKNLNRIPIAIIAEANKVDTRNHS